MAEYNEFGCVNDQQNTGIGICNAEFGKLLTEIAVPVGTSITRTQLATLQTVLNTLLINDSKLARGYKLPNYITITDNTADPVTEGFDFGVNIVIGDSAIEITRRFIEGALCAHLAMRSFNGQTSRYEFLQVYAARSGGGYYIAGRKYFNSTTGEDEMRGMRYDDFYTDAWKQATGTTTQMFMIRSSMGDVMQMNENMIFTKVDWNPKDLATIMGVKVSLVKSSTGVFDALTTLSCGGTNLTELYPALADSDAWVVKNNLGNVVATTGVTISGTKFRLALDTADANYTAGTSFTAELAAISVTSASPFNIEYIESNTSNAVAK